MSERREWWIRITESPCDLAIPPGVILDDYLKSGMELVHVREVLLGEDERSIGVSVAFAHGYEAGQKDAEQRHAKLVDFLKELERRMDVEWSLSEPRRTELHYWGHLIRSALAEVSDE